MLNSHYKAALGCDPELFIRRNDGTILGSEKIIPLEGLLADGYAGKVIRDGVQVELNPTASPTYAGIRNNIAECLRVLNKSLTPGIELCWDGVVEVTREELDSLSPGARELGCQPSENIWGSKPITVDSKLYRKRSAGGHPHFGISNSYHLWKARTEVVPLLDILLGNTMVLLDRDPGAAERRENYGRAGEYRLQPHGLEYRTLSNCWLRAYGLMELVFGMGRAALSIIEQGIVGENIENDLISTINIDNFITAIDTNSWDLAMLNFQSIKPFIVKHFPVGEFPIDRNNIDRFEVLAHGVNDKGLAYYFPVDPIESWTKGYNKPFSQVLTEVY